MGGVFIRRLGGFSIRGKGLTTGGLMEQNCNTDYPPPPKQKDHNSNPKAHEGGQRIMLGYWVAVRLSYHNPKTILFTIYPYNGNLS